MAHFSIPRTSGIYIILNTKTGKVYIGQAVDFRGRWQRHKKDLNTGRHYNGYLQAAWNKYGAKAFKFQKLEYCPVDQLDEREQHYLNVYVPKGLCYNIATDAIAPMRGRHLSTEAKHKISAANKNRPPPTEEAKRRISEANTGRPKSPETLLKISQAGLGRKHTLEARQKISAAHKGRKHTEETKRKMSEIAKRRPPQSEETRQKNSEALKGRIFSEEHRRKIGEANKRRSAETRRKISESNSRRGCSLETRLKMSESRKRFNALKKMSIDINDIDRD